MTIKKNRKKVVLVIHPTRYDTPSLSCPSINSSYDLIWYPESTKPEHQISHPNVGPLTVNIHPEETLAELRYLAHEHQVDGIMSAQDYPGNILASIVAQERSLPAALPELVTGFQHKAYSRRLQNKYVPQVTPSFGVIDPDLLTDEQINVVSFPLFVKPIKANFSIFAHRVNSPSQLREVVSTYKLPVLFTQQFDWYMQKLNIKAETAECYIAEQLLEGIQVTLEGYVYQKEVTIVGVVDSIMYPGTNSFERFVYPSSMPLSVQQRMQDAAKIIMQSAGYNNGFFNIEFMYNTATDVIGIIEINPRMASQFADLYEKVDGFNTYHQLLSIATGMQPFISKGNGSFAMAASCVLRIFQDKRVMAIPTNLEIEQVKKEFPESAVFVKTVPGQRLSDIEQDGKSFAYALIHIGGFDYCDINAKLDRIKKILQFSFLNI